MLVMGTDRTEYIRQLCPCGKGEIVINHAAPDHPFGGGKFSWELWLQCDKCESEFSLIHQDKDAVLVRREEIDRREQTNHTIYERERELEKSDKVQGYIRQFAQLIANQDTEKRKFRYGPPCLAYGLSNRRISKELSVDEIDDLIKKSFRLKGIASLLKQIGIEDDELIAELAEHARLHVGMGVPYTVVGDPIVELTEEAYYKGKK